MAGLLSEEVDVKRSAGLRLFFSTIVLVPFCLALSGAVGAAGAVGESIPGTGHPVRRITLDEALARVERDNLSFRITAEDLETARAQ